MEWLNNHVCVVLHMFFFIKHIWWHHSCIMKLSAQNFICTVIANTIQKQVTVTLEWLRRSYSCWSNLCDYLLHVIICRQRKCHWYHFQMTFLFVCMIYSVIPSNTKFSACFSTTNFLEWGSSTFVESSISVVLSMKGTCVFRCVGKVQPISIWK